MSFDRAKLFSTNALHPREVTACGETFTVYVRRLPAVDLRKFNAEVMSPEITTRARAGFDALAKSIRKEDGSAFATRDEYEALQADALGALMEAFSEVNARESGADLGNA